MEFIKNDLINAVLENYFQTFSRTLDTADYVPEKYGKKIHAFIFKNMKSKFKEIKREYRKQKKSASDGAAASLRAAPSEAGANTTS